MLYGDNLYVVFSTSVTDANIRMHVFSVGEGGVSGGPGSLNLDFFLGCQILDL